MCRQDLSILLIALASKNCTKIVLQYARHNPGILIIHPRRTVEYIFAPFLPYGQDPLALFLSREARRILAYRENINRVHIYTQELGKHSLIPQLRCSY